MMRFDCAAGKHVPATAGVRNQGFEFGCCRGCGRDLVRSRGAWRTVPRGSGWCGGSGRRPRRRARRSCCSICRRTGARSTPLPAPAAAEAPARRGRGGGRARHARRSPGALAERLRAWLRTLLAPRPGGAARCCACPCPERGAPGGARIGSGRDARPATAPAAAARGEARMLGWIERCAREGEVEVRILLGAQPCAALSGSRSRHRR